MTLMEQFAFEFQLWFSKVILNVITSGHLLGHPQMQRLVWLVASGVIIIVTCQSVTECQDQDT